jgi:hypothetical protein
LLRANKSSATTGRLAPAIAQGSRESMAYPAGTHRASVNGSAASFWRSLQVGVPRTVKSMR